MEAFLVIALIISNIGWLLYLGRRDLLDIEERKELRNRIAEPEMIIPPKEVVKANLEAVKNRPAELFPDADQSELAAVGRIDPPVLREDGKD